MLRELEQRLVTVLGADLPAPLTGRVTIRPDAATGNQPAAQVAVRKVLPMTPDFGAVRPEIAPGADAARRIVRLEAEIDIRVSAGGGTARDDRVGALDDLIYFLDAPTMRSGAALRDSGDPGFLLESLVLSAGDYAPELTDPVPADLTLTAVGWFWPVGEAGADGPAIAEARISLLVYPANTTPDPARFEVGDGETEIAVAFSDVQRLTLTADGIGETENGRVVFQLRAEDGSAGAGTLTNGRNLAEGDRSRPLSEAGRAQIRYQPPASPAVDRLVVRQVQEDSEDHYGPVLLELALITEAPA